MTLLVNISIVIFDFLYSIQQFYFTIEALDEGINEKFEDYVALDSG